MPKAEQIDTAVLYVVVGIIGLLMLALLPAYVQVLRNGFSGLRKTGRKGTTVHCGHCGRRLSGDPVMAIAVADSGYFVYKCASCGNRTLLPTQAGV